ncbi:MAG: hypothetical protein ACXW5U_10415 [Thermoanaerobaculia bacterium]
MWDLLRSFPEASPSERIAAVGETSGRRDGQHAAEFKGGDISTSIQLRREIAGSWLLMSKGVLLLVFGVLVSTSFTVIAELFPQVRAVVLAWMIAAFALLEGGLLLMLAEQLRRTVPRVKLRPTAA